MESMNKISSIDRKYKTHIKSKLFIKIKEFSSIFKILLFHLIYKTIFIIFKKYLLRETC